MAIKWGTKFYWWLKSELVVIWTNCFPCSLLSWALNSLDGGVFPFPRELWGSLMLMCKYPLLSSKVATCSEISRPVGKIFLHCPLPPCPCQTVFLNLCSYFWMELKSTCVEKAQPVGFIEAGKWQHQSQCGFEVRLTKWQTLQNCKSQWAVRKFSYEPNRSHMMFQWH